MQARQRAERPKARGVAFLPLTGARRVSLARMGTNHSTTGGHWEKQATSTKLLQPMFMRYRKSRGFNGETPDEQAS